MSTIFRINKQNTSNKLIFPEDVIFALRIEGSDKRNNIKSEHGLLCMLIEWVSSYKQSYRNVRYSFTSEFIEYCFSEIDRGYCSSNNLDVRLLGLPKIFASWEKCRRDAIGNVLKPSDELYFEKVFNWFIQDVKSNFPSYVKSKVDNVVNSLSEKKVYINNIALPFPSIGFIWFDSRHVFEKSKLDFYEYILAYNTYTGYKLFGYELPRWFESYLKKSIYINYKGYSVPLSIGSYSFVFSLLDCESPSKDLLIETYIKHYMYAQNHGTENKCLSIYALDISDYYDCIESNIGNCYISWFVFFACFNSGIIELYPLAELDREKILSEYIVNLQVSYSSEQFQEHNDYLLKINTSSYDYINEVKITKYTKAIYSYFFDNKDIDINHILVQSDEVQSLFFKDEFFKESFFNILKSNLLKNMNYEQLCINDNIIHSVFGSLGSSFAISGVNIIGRVSGELGIGEDSRMAIKSLDSVGIDSVAIDIEDGLACGSNDKTYADRIVSNPRYFINLIFMPPADTFRIINKMDKEVSLGRYNIGIWPWELPKWPDSLSCVFDVVDEIWAPTDFIANVFRAESKGKPVLKIPFASEVPDNYENIKSELGIDESTFTYITIFDGNSSFDRKNPFDVVKAFRNVFSNTEENVKLIVKGMNCNQVPSKKKELEDLIGEDPKIIFIDDVLPKDKSIGLLSSSDCLVSLHRSEGFGRNISEAMLLGVPVIVSNWSGNTDFTTEDNAFLVDGELIPVEKGQYAFYEEQYWFNPDLESASDMIRKVYYEKGLAEQKSNKAREYIAKRYNTNTIGEGYRNRLKELGVIK